MLETLHRRLLACYYAFLRLLRTRVQFPSDSYKSCSHRLINIHKLFVLSCLISLILHARLSNRISVMELNIMTTDFRMIFSLMSAFCDSWFLNQFKYYALIGSHYLNEWLRGKRLDNQAFVTRSNSFKNPLVRYACGEHRSSQPPRSSVRRRRKFKSINQVNTNDFSTNRVLDKWQV